jgi:hypothetical protein
MARARRLPHQRMWMMVAMNMHCGMMVMPAVHGFAPLRHGLLRLNGNGSEETRSDDEKQQSTRFHNVSSNQSAR